MRYRIDIPFSTLPAFLIQMKIGLNKFRHQVINLDVTHCLLQRGKVSYGKRLIIEHRTTEGGKLT